MTTQTIKIIVDRLNTPVSTLDNEHNLFKTVSDILFTSLVFLTISDATARKRDDDYLFDSLHSTQKQLTFLIQKDRVHI
jgi:hypothetical protein